MWAHQVKMGACAYNYNLRKWIMYCLKPSKHEFLLSVPKLPFYLMRPRIIFVAIACFKIFHSAAVHDIYHILLLLLSIYSEGKSFLNPLCPNLTSRMSTQCLT